MGGLRGSDSSRGDDEALKAIAYWLGQLGVLGRMGR